ncbi:hypothetical protein E2C01_039854 [Portunus trituberculatus]|uniref:Uncharacterized protein n=1 Tax=Portunus trituberculatus TaxID=210409 RepID=A0A5B7FL46_PORTR|nr:hypothetical protein [Portunus trituberculatus]
MKRISPPQAQLLPAFTVILLVLKAFPAIPWL